MKQWNSMGEWLRGLRRRRGLKLKEVGWETGLSVSYLSDLERDVVDPSLKTIKKLAEFYHLKLSEFFREIE